MLLLLFQPAAINMLPAQFQIPGLDITAAAQAGQQPTEVLALMNMVTVDELCDDDEYEGKRFVFIIF